MKVNKRGKGIIIKNATIGKGTEIWHYANLFGCKIGKNCKIGSFVEIGQDVEIGDDCKIEAFTFIPTGVKIGNKVFIGPGVIFTNDLIPRIGKAWKIVPTIVEEEVSIGANATIRCGVTIGKNALVGCGAVVTKDIQAETVVAGNPAKFLRRIRNDETN